MTCVDEKLYGLKLAFKLLCSLSEFMFACFDWLNHGLFTNGWETRSRDVWKPVSNRTPGIISKICKLGNLDSRAIHVMPFSSGDSTASCLEEELLFPSAQACWDPTRFRIA